MTRLIDADKFKDSMKYVCDSGGWLEPVTTAVKEYVVKNIDAQPTVDAVPVEWLRQKQVEHSNDGFEWLYDEIINEWEQEQDNGKTD